ncbi:hypothetical protein [Nocardia niwae]|uniref:DUF8020 domain-containing protein n=1 Tax=Nocardia niwae TaxID=626084 RepID=A0ABV2X6Z5_9NOCA|nr:hypothetical protein [Nocardia niwae]
MHRITTTLVATAVAVLAGTATASADTPEAVSYHSSLAGTSVVTTLENGTFATTTAGADVRDSNGRVLETLPTSAVLDGQRILLGQWISPDGRTLTLTPDLSGLDRAALRPIASPRENQLALNDVINAVNIGSSLGSLVGTAIGAVAGIGIGFVLSGASCVALSLGCVVAVLPIMALTAGVGGIAGAVLGGGPAAVGAAFEYFSVLNAPEGGSKYADTPR